MDNIDILCIGNGSEIFDTDFRYKNTKQLFKFTLTSIVNKIIIMKKYR